MSDGSFSGPFARLHANEADDGPTEDDVAAIVTDLRGANRYPGRKPADLIGVIAALEGVDADQVVCGPGSAALCLSLCLAARRMGIRRVVVSQPSYEGYARVAAMAGLSMIAVPLQDHYHDLRSLAQTADSAAPALVFLPNPNNPTATSLSRDVWRTFLLALPPGCLVVVDEAYIDYDDARERNTAVRLVESFASLVVLRTFSKAYGLAGARLAYCCTRADVSRLLESFVLDYSIPRWTERLGLRRLQDPSILDATQRTVRRRDAFVAELASRGVKTPPSSANFVWLPLAGGATAARDRAAGRGLHIKAYPDLGVRVTIGRWETLAGLVQVLS